MMKVLAQKNNMALLDVDYIYLLGSNQIIAMTKLQDRFILGVYKDIEKRTRNVIYTSKEICEKVFELMYDYFLENPNGIYKMPTQEEMEMYFNETCRHN